MSLLMGSLYSTGHRLQTMVMSQNPDVFVAVAMDLGDPTPLMVAYTPEISKMLGQGFLWQEELLLIGTLLPITVAILPNLPK